MTELLSRPARLGYLAGIALTIVVGQAPKIFGFAIEPDDLLGQIREIADAVGAVWPMRPRGDRGLGPGRPGRVGAVGAARAGDPVVVIGGIAAVALLDLSIDRVGGLEGPADTVVPSVPANALPELIVASFAIALVATADTSVLSQALAARRKEEVDPDRELVALGVANFATGFFQGFPISSSGSRTPVAIEAGARSQLTPLVGAATVAIMLLVAPGVLRDLPQAVLGAVVIAAAIRLVDAREIGASGG